MYNLLKKQQTSPPEKSLGIKNMNLKMTSGEKCFLTHLNHQRQYSSIFQIRINHLILEANTLLCKIKLIGDPKCTFCTKTDETIEHLLHECECVKQF